MDKWYFRCTLVLIVTVLVIGSSALASQHILISVPELVNSTVIAGDVLDVGMDQLVVAHGSRVDIYLDGEIVSSITDVNGNITAMATGDLTGNFRSELLIGTENAVFYVYQYQDGQWNIIAEHRHLWAPVSQIITGDITGNGWGDVVVMNSRGELFVFLSFQGELDIFWRSKAGNNVRIVEVADLNGDLAEEIVLAYQSGQVAILSWHDSQLNVVWENYPWGTVNGLMVGKINPNHRFPEVMIASSQGIFYTWQWSGSDFVGTRRFSQSLEGKFTYLESMGLLNFPQEHGISLYRIDSTGLTKQWEVVGIKVSDILEFNRRKLVKDDNKNYYWLEKLDIASIKVYLDGVLYKEPTGLLFVGEQPYLPISETAKMLGWTVLGNKRIFISKGLDYVVVEPETETVLWNNLSIPSKIEVINHNSNAYVPLDFFSMLGYEIKFDMVSLKLTIDKIWGWWFW